MSSHVRRTVTCCVLMLLAGAIAFGLEQSSLRFEVSSIKPNNSGATSSGGACFGADKKHTRAIFDVPLGHCTFHNVQVEYLIDAAYRAEVTPGADHPVLVGLPAWAKSERFDVETKAEDLNAPEAQLYEMVRALLSDRFHLEFHRVTNEVSGYRLIIAKGGHKLITPKPDMIVSSFGGRGPQGEAISRNAPFEDLVSFLTHQLDSPVDNGTELTGNYDFHLTFDPISTGHRFSNGLPAEIPDRPSIFAALQEQLGLKLEKARLPVVSYVVDSIQRPTVN